MSKMKAFHRKQVFDIVYRKEFFMNEDGKIAIYARKSKLTETGKC